MATKMLTFVILSKAKNLIPPQRGAEVTCVTQHYLSTKNASVAGR
jgi:hypothetical protein